MDQDRPTLIERIRSAASGPNMAECVGHDSMAVHCGRCGKPLVMLLEDIKDKRTIDCDACEKQRPVGNGLPIPRPSHVPASADAGRADGLESLGAHVLLDEAGNPLTRGIPR